MFKITNYLKEYKKESIIAPLFKMLEASFELLVPLVMSAIVETGIKNQDTGYIAKMGGILVLLAVVGLTCSIVAQYFAAKAAIGFGKNVRRDLFAHINRLSYQELDQAGTSTLITRMTNDINQMQSGVNMFLRLFLRSPFIVFGAMIMAFVVDVKAAMVFVVAIPLLSIVVFGIMLYSIPLYQKVQKAVDKVLLITRENLAGARVIRAFNRQQDEKTDFREGSETLYKIQMFVGKVSAVMNPVTYIIVNVAIIAIIWVSGIRVNTGRLEQGQVIALVNYMSQILVELVKLANLIILLTKAMACSKRVGEVFAMEPSIVEAEHTKSGEGSKYKVQFNHVTFTYAGSKEPSLQDISFQAEEGQTIGIIGGTGCGKSTLVNLIPRFYDVTSGEILVNGIDVRNYNFEYLNNIIGYVPQKATLFSGNILSNITMGKNIHGKPSKDKIKDAIRVSQAEEFISKLDGKGKAHIAQGGTNVSGGQKQRLSIARTIARDPEIYIFDDSFSALDYKTDSVLRSELKKYSNATVLIVAQRIGTIFNADKIVVLDNGKCVGIGTHKELMKKCKVYKEIALSQVSKEELENV